MNEPIKPTDFKFTNEGQRKHSYIHVCKGCHMVDSFIPATEEGLHLNCPAGRSSIGWAKFTREEWESFSEERKAAYRAETIARHERLMRRIDESINANKPHCPTCNSIKVTKIGALDRAASIATFGIFSRKINKQFKCQNCGYMW